MKTVIMSNFMLLQLLSFTWFLTSLGRTYTFVIRRCSAMFTLVSAVSRLQILLNDVESHQSAIDQVNSAGQNVISSEGGAEASQTRDNLDQLNQRWESVLG